MNNQIVYKNQIRSYSIWIGLGGIIFPLIAWLIDTSLKDMPFGLSEIIQIHLENPLHWIIDLAPFVLSFATYYILYYFHKRHEDLNLRLNTELEKTKKILEFTENLRQRKFDTKFFVDGDADELGKSLVQLRDNLKKNKEEEINRRREDDQRHWATAGLAKFGEILRNYNDNMEDLSYQVISNLVNYLNVNQGGFYILHDENIDEKYFELIASHAFDRKKYSDKKIPWGEGLIGVCALEKDTVFIKQVTDSYVTITSGLGKANPRCILIVPLKINDEVQAVIEFASFRVLEKFEIEFVEKLAESIAATVASYKINARTARLLIESQKQAEKLAKQEILVRQNLDELKVTQEEAAKQSEQFVSFTNSVNHTLIRAEYNTSGVLLYANTKFLKKLGYGTNSEVEGKHISIFINKKDREWFNKIWDGLVKGGPHFEGDMKHVTKQGKDLWTMATYVSIRNNDGKPQKILFLGIDTTDQKKQSLDYEGQMNALNRSSVKAEFTPEGKIIDCNEKFLDALKYTKNEIKTKIVYDFFDKDDIKDFIPNWSRVVQETPYEGQVRFIKKNGEDIWFHSDFTAVHDMYGDVAKVIFIANDITEQKRLEQNYQQQNEQLRIQEEKLRMNEVDLSKKLKETREEMKMQFKEIETVKMLNEKTLQGLHDAVVTINKRDIIVFYNQASENLWGYTRDEVIGKKVHFLLPHEYHTNSDEFLGKYFKISAENKMIGQRKEMFIINKFGERVQILVTLSEAQYGNEYNLTAFIQHIEVELF